MNKPRHIDGYGEQLTLDCERVLVTLLAGMGPWKESVCLVGGLTPRYLVTARPPVVPPHAGTQDVDIVVDLAMLNDIEAYHSLEQNFKRMGFERGTNDRGTQVSWRWQIRTEAGSVMLVELLADDTSIQGGRVQELPTAGTISAINIPYSSMVFDLFEVVNVTAELLDNGGMATEPLKHANIVSFTCLKAFAFDQRRERKDAHDLVYCLENSSNDIEQIAAAFKTADAQKHQDAINNALSILRNRFATTAEGEGYKKDGPVSVALFEHGSGDDEGLKDLRILRQRQATDVIERLLRSV